MDKEPREAEEQRERRSKKTPPASNFSIRKPFPPSLPGPFLSLPWLKSEVPFEINNGDWVEKGFLHIHP